MNKTIVKGLIFWIGIFYLTFLDQITKFLAIHYLQNNASIPIIPSVVHLTLVQNKGAAFGILPGNRIFFITIAALLLLSFVLYNRRIIRQNIFMVLAYTLIGGGTLGNMIDRFKFGSVVDFLDFLIWPVFNFADTFICIGVIIIIICSLLSSKTTS